MLNSNGFPMFSVVIPMYNVSKYIAKSISSVLSQSVVDFEVICVDDGCTDDTLSVLSSFNDSRIHLVRQQNLGLSAARNTGINASNGIYIALLDADDFWHKDKLKEHLRHFTERLDVGISYSASAFVDEHGQLMGIGQNPKLKDVSSADIFCRNPIGNGSAAVIRRTVLNQIAFRSEQSGHSRICYFDESMRQSEDVECWLRISLTSSWKFEGIAKALCFYRLNSGGLSANLDAQYKAWSLSINKNRHLFPEFFDTYFNLASSYQMRYLSRRAIQNGNHRAAISLIHEAIKNDIRILFQEPARTIITLLCAYLSVLPCSFYNKLQAIGMRLMGRYKLS